MLNSIAVRKYCREEGMRELEKDHYVMQQFIKYII